GRNTDSAPANIGAVPGVVEVVSARVPVLLDGGVRRGTDVVKALALGAKAVLIGRPYLWALAARGARGVEHALRTLQLELQAAMALCGTPTLKSVDSKVLWPGCSPAGEQLVSKGGAPGSSGGRRPGAGGVRQRRGA